MVLRVSRRYREVGKREERILKLEMGDRKREVWVLKKRKEGGTGGGMSIVNKYYERCLSLGLRLISGCDVLAKKQ